MKTKIILTIGCLLAVSQAFSQWSLSGNANTTTSHFLGTTDAKDLRLRTSNTTRMTINSAGYAGVGVTPSSTSRLYSSLNLPAAIGQNTVYSAARGGMNSNSGLSNYANGYLGVYYQSTAIIGGFPSAFDFVGVLGTKENVGGNGVGTMGWNKQASVNEIHYGVYGLANGNVTGTSAATDRNVGVFGTASGNAKNVGVYGLCSGSSNWAGYFTGRGYFSDRLGIGVEDPSSMLTVDAPASTGILSFRSQGSTKMFLNSAGTLGIGNVIAGIDARLLVNSGGITQAVFGTQGTGVSLLSSYPGIAFNSYYTTAFKAIQAGYGADITCDPTTGSLWFRSHGNASANGTQTFATRMTVHNDGRVVIGNIAPATNYLLSVDGRIMCEELKVQNSGSWPDYVFAADYNLPALSEVEKHINEKGHLIGIPSASEVEENGVGVGDMQKKLLEKIEELTLYVITLEKKVNALESK